MVPVASWVRVWSTLRAISWPALGVLDTRCSSMTLRVRLLPIPKPPLARGRLLGGPAPCGGKKGPKPPAAADALAPFLKAFPWPRLARDCRPKAARWARAEVMGPDTSIIPRRAREGVGRRL